MMKKIIGVFLIICVLIIFGVIFMFSAQNASESGSVSRQTTKSIGRKLKEWPVFKEIKNKVNVMEANYFVRKFAHFSLYMMVGVLMTCVLLVLRTTEKHCAIISLGIGVVYAILDEFHQWFVPGREARVTDVMIDAFGVIVGICIIFVCRKIIQMIKIRIKTFKNFFEKRYKENLH